MSTKSKSIETKTDFNQDERLKKVSKLRLLLNRPDLKKYAWEDMKLLRDSIKEI